MNTSSDQTEHRTIKTMIAACCHQLSAERGKKKKDNQKDPTTHTHTHTHTNKPIEEGNEDGAAPEQIQWKGTTVCCG